MLLIKFLVFAPCKNGLILSLEVGFCGFGDGVFVTQSQRGKKKKKWDVWLSLKNMVSKDISLDALAIIHFSSLVFSSPYSSLSLHDPPMLVLRLSLWQIEWKTVNRRLPYIRLLARLFEVAKNKHPNLNHFENCKSVDPIFSSFNTSNLNILLEHGASLSHAQPMNSEEQIEYKTNSRFEETTWSKVERENSLNEVLGKEEEENLSFGDTC
uniref:Uncharacterized protein n=1 Tax=Tanacetum cinerariifolium TaxID=118510 RepID=A0A6L2K039_TANCI|nr:hypothetical protein [Tanacetum cinerariifolium]